MHRSTLLAPVVSLVLAGCGGGHGAPAASSEAAAAPAPASAAATSPETPCAERRASKTEHLGMGWVTIAIRCDGERPVVIESTVEARGEADEHSYPMGPAAWDAFWRRLDAVSWEDLTSPCPPAAAPPDSVAMTELELDLVVGDTARQVTCAGADLAPIHEAIIGAFDDALTAARGD